MIMPYLPTSRLITRVYSARDSISTRPRIIANRIAATAAGLRAMRLRCRRNRPALPESAKTRCDTHCDVRQTSTKSVTAASAGVCCALRENRARQCHQGKGEKYHLALHLFAPIICRQEVVRHRALGRRALTLEALQKRLMLVRNRFPDVHHGKQHKDVRLQERHKRVKADKDHRDD